MFHGPQRLHGRQCLPARARLGLLLTAAACATGTLAVGIGKQVALATPWGEGDDGDRLIRFQRFSEHGCTGDIIDLYEMKYRATGLFEIVLENLAEQPYYLEFKCDQDSIHGLYHMKNDPASDQTRYSVWWVTDIWRNMSLGECVETMGGSIQYDQPFPPAVVEAVGGCLDREAADAAIDWYDGLDCDENMAHGIFLEKRIYTDGCIDVVNKKYVRYGQRFKCEDSALVEHYYPDFDRCSIDTDPRYNRYEHIWTYQRWRRFMEGGCIRFEETNSIKVHNPAAYRRIVRAIERTPCGNPIASFNIYSDRRCEDKVLTQEIVDIDAAGCIKMTSYDKRKMLRFCLYNTTHVNILVFNAGGCLSPAEGSGYLTEPEFSQLRAGECMKVASLSPSLGPFYQLSFYPGHSDPFEAMGACVDFGAA